MKRCIIEYYSNILANVDSYLLQYKVENNFMHEKHKINDIIQLKDYWTNKKIIYSNILIIYLRIKVENIIKILIIYIH